MPVRHASHEKEWPPCETPKSWVGMTTLWDIQVMSRNDHPVRHQFMSRNDHYVRHQIMSRNDHHVWHQVMRRNDHPVRHPNHEQEWSLSEKHKSWDRVVVPSHNLLSRRVVIPSCDLGSHRVTILSEAWWPTVDHSYGLLSVPPVGHLDQTADLHLCKSVC